MYEKHFGLTTKPFQTIPNPDVFYPSPKHENALTYLEYGLMERIGFILLTGEIGSGKTTLVKYLVNKVESQIDTAVIFNTNVTSEQLIGLILNEFEIGPGNGSKADNLDALYRFLIGKYARNRRVLLIIDEAQNLGREALEEVRMLSNLQSDDQMLLQIMLVGQPELRVKLKRPNLAQLNQRITVAYHLPSLTREETGAYIAFRLEKAGGRPDIFSSEAVDLIHKASGGIPRTINIICDTALVYAYADDEKNVYPFLIEQVIEDREGMGLSFQGPDMAQKERAQENSALLKRIENVEEGLARLQNRLENRMGELEREAHVTKDELVNQYRERFEKEHAKNKKILVEYAKLREKYLALLKKSTMPAGEAAPAAQTGSPASTGARPEQGRTETDKDDAMYSRERREAGEALLESAAQAGSTVSEKAGPRKTRKKATKKPAD